jgi:spore coat protein CotH
MLVSSVACSEDATAPEKNVFDASVQTESEPTHTSDSGTNRPAWDGGVAVRDPSDEIFDDQRVPRFDLELGSEAWAALTREPGEYVRANLRYGAELVRDVGVRIKGEASLRTLDQKAAFKIKFDEFVAGQSFRGLKRLTLNNMMEDPSFVAERLSYHFFRLAGLPAPRCNSALVYVNGVHFGLYSNVESEDKVFLRRWFTSDQGNLYEEGQVDFVPGAADQFDLETNEKLDDRTDLVALIDAVTKATPDTLLADLEPVLDVQQFLHFSAAEAAVNQWDGYAYTLFYPNNFRLYHDPSSRKFVFLPWGMDMSMKPYSPTGRANVSVYGIAHEQDSSERDVTSGIVFQKCMESRACKARYTDAMRDIIGVYERADLMRLAVQFHDQVRDLVRDDPRRECTVEEFEEAYQSVLTTIATRVAALRADLDG